VSIKQVNSNRFSSDITKMLENFEHEAKISCALCPHPNLIRSYGIWLDQQDDTADMLTESMIVMGKRKNLSYADPLSEYMDIDLKKFCEFLFASFTDLHPSLLWSILSDIAKGLHFLHLQNYVHRDICTG
jgi:serine/threonine protein kinase